MLRAGIPIFLICPLLALMLVPACQTEAGEPPHLLHIDTPDKGYLHLPVRITDRSTAPALTFDPQRDPPATISYRLTRDGMIRVRVVWRQNPDLVLRTLLDWTKQDFGPHSLTWDGRDASGNLVDNRRAWVTFEGDDSRHLGHPVKDCHELAVEIDMEAPVAVLDSLGQLSARLIEDTPFGREGGYTVRCYLDFQPWGEARVEATTDRFTLPCDSRLPAGEHLLTINVDDGADHAAVASLVVQKGSDRTTGRGRTLFIEAGCPACHLLDNATWHEEGPGLLHIGSRRPRDFLHRIIRSPRSLNRTSQMPKDPLSEAEVTVLVDYLASLKRPPGAAVRPGSTIYHDEGCADCHDTPGEFGSMPGPALAGIGRLRSDTYLEGVILNPGDWFPRTAMPPTVLESPELANLIAYLREL